MSSLTTREYAYFRIAGQGGHEVITEKLGREPSHAWSEGDERRSGKRYEFMSWRLNSGLPDTEPLESHIDALLDVLGTRAAALRELSVDYHLVIQCVGYFPPYGHGAHLNRDIVRAAAHLGLSFDFDFYYVGEHEPKPAPP